MNRAGIALIGAAVGAIPAALAAWRGAVHAERGKFKQILIEASQRAWIERFKGVQQPFPFEHQMLYTTLMASLCSDIHHMDDGAIRAELDRIRRIMDMVSDSG
jgi:hypothetical protein